MSAQPIYIASHIDPSEDNEQQIAEQAEAEMHYPWVKTDYICLCCGDHGTTFQHDLRSTTVVGKDRLELKCLQGCKEEYTCSERAMQMNTENIGG